MAASRVIESLIITPEEDPLSSPLRPGRRAISVGIAAPGQRPAWGLCLGSPHPLPVQPPPEYLASTLRRRAQEVVAPALVGKPLTDFRALAEALDQATEAPAPEPDAPEEAPDVEGRFSAWVRPPDQAQAGLSDTENRANERLIRRALRYGTGQALLEAASLAQGRSMAEVLAEAYDFPRPGQTVPLLLVREGFVSPPAAALAGEGVQALGFSVQDGHPQVVLGEDAAIVQRFLRQVKDELVASGGKPGLIALHLDVKGSLGELFDQDQGKMLGALFGLGQATSPLHLHVQDPVVAGDAPAQQAQMAGLQALVRMREMKVSLAAGAWVDSLARVRDWLQAGAGDPIHIDLARLGSLNQAALAVKACQEQGVGAAVRGAPAGYAGATPLACHFALATRPGLLIVQGDAGPAQEEMGRALAGLRARRG